MHRDHNSQRPGAPPGQHRLLSFHRGWLIWPVLAIVGACGSSQAPASPPAAMAGAPAPMPDMGGMAPAVAEPPAPPAPMAVAADDEMADRPAAAGKIAGEMPAQPGPMWAPVREFPAPTYDPNYDGPRTDFRETIYWKPSIQTDSQGKAQVSFFLSDSVTSFRATVEGAGGGSVGRGDAVIGSKLPVSLAAKMPLEVTAGDIVELPVVITNGTFRGIDANVNALVGPALSSKEPLSAKVHLDGQQTKTVYYTLNVGGNGENAADGKIGLSAEGGHLTDSMERTLKVVPAGFPREENAAGTVATGATASETIDLADPLPGTVTASIEFFPSPKSTLVAAAKGMLAEPSGCFEQTSSTNYPNVMVASYLKKAADPDQETKANIDGLLERGYKKLAGYETASKGYEWFGENPGHEALTAYGLLEFVDMLDVYKGVDQEMISRTRAWLKTRRDGKGGYQRNGKALDSFGRAKDETTNAYITWALAEAGEKDMEAELDYVAKLSKSTEDPYLLGLSASALAAARPDSDAMKAAMKKLLGKQDKEGGFPGAAESITQSGGQALAVETTSLAALALMRGDTEQKAAAGKAIRWLEEQRKGSGSFGSTQATVLALRALTRASDGGSVPEGTLSLSVNGKNYSLKVDPKNPSELKLVGFAGDLKSGKNAIAIAGPGMKDLKLPYAIKVGYRTVKPNSAAKGAVEVAVSAPKDAKVGESVKVKVEIANLTGNALPMVLARVGVPGGLEQQKWQLDELKKKGIIDFYETREREVIFYLRGMAPKGKKTLDINLLAAVPGTYTAPASQAYLYYTDELRRYADPIKMTIRK